MNKKETDKSFIDEANRIAYEQFINLGTEFFFIADCSNKGIESFFLVKGQFSGLGHYEYEILKINDIESVCESIENKKYPKPSIVVPFSKTDYLMFYDWIFVFEPEYFKFIKNNFFK